MEMPCSRADERWRRTQGNDSSSPKCLDGRVSTWLTPTKLVETRVSVGRKLHFALCQPRSDRQSRRKILAPNCVNASSLRLEADPGGGREEGGGKRVSRETILDSTRTLNFHSWHRSASRSVSRIACTSVRVRALISPARHTTSRGGKVYQHRYLSGRRRL